MAFRINHYPSKQRPDPVRPVYTHLTYYPAIQYTLSSRYSKLLCLRTAHKIHPNKFNPQAFEQSYAKTYHKTAPRTLISESADSDFYEVTSVTENRLDIIANNVYSTSSLWWIIAEANKDILFDPMNVPRGTVLRIPSLTSIYSGGVL